MTTPLFRDAEGRVWEDATDPKMWYGRAAEGLNAADLKKTVTTWCSEVNKARLAQLLGVQTTEPEALVQALIDKVRKSGSPGLAAMKAEVPNHPDENYLYVFLNGLEQGVFFREEEAAG